MTLEIAAADPGASRRAGSEEFRDVVTEIRDQLAGEGIQLKDGKDPAYGRAGHDVGGEDDSTEACQRPWPLSLTVLRTDWT